MEQIRTEVAGLEIHAGTAESIHCTISIGVVKNDGTTKTLDDLLHKADSFLYKAKGLGRNKTIFRI